MNLTLNALITTAVDNIVFFVVFFFSEVVCVEVLQPSQPNGVMSSAVSLPNYTVYWAGLVI